ncbi:MAG: ATP-binding protein [Candidatus Caenarcaniphilales bacterium]|nr:ATP-binding protein [Candidatus Caenarcaniphilales bacterium]
MVFIKREIENYLKTASEQFSAVVLTGARQVGKSTLTQKIFPKYNYVSLDEIDTRNFAINDPRGFLNHYSYPLIIDEIQEVPELLNYVKKIIDERRDETGLFIITGSQQFSLMAGVQETLAGRAAILDLHCFSIHELNIKAKKDWAYYVEKGFYPELHQKKQIDKNLWYSSYIKTFLERDIKSNLQKNYLKHYEQFLNLIIARCSQELNYADISKDLGVDEKTIKTWVSFLERSQIIFLLAPYPKRIDKKQISKKSKIYFYDSGLVAHRLGYHTEEQIKNGPLSGALFENLVISEIHKRKQASQQSGYFYYFREKHGLEIDLIYENQLQQNIIEIKQSETPHIGMAKNLLKFNELVDNVKNIFLISPRKENFEQKEVKFRYFKDFFDLKELTND